ncbi:MAG: hypothetical protein PHI27_01870 [Eubacteriales bacterium]|nr:hypothetical protein [Eubacteriales bacterium]MDD3880979.1 hypothetical protein [Eubacteriales bacterium]MDD4511952.1 hypothetical protein [Eubacteriales bacterium]
MDKKELREEKIAALSGAGVETTGGRLNLAGADTEDKAVMTDDEAEGVTGGEYVPINGYAMVNGPLYLSSYAEVYSGWISNRRFKIQRYVSGRAAPYLLATDVGWVPFDAVKKIDS